MLGDYESLVGKLRRCRRKSLVRNWRASEIRWWTLGSKCLFTSYVRKSAVESHHFRLNGLFSRCTADPYAVDTRQSPQIRMIHKTYQCIAFISGLPFPPSRSLEGWRSFVSERRLAHPAIEFSARLYPSIPCFPFFAMFAVRRFHPSYS